jgi:hypothetical protein|tara:strand:+ start:70 stop:279 length:210 start_codon:yes stop_codon:yes gene_type:complete
MKTKLLFKGSDGKEFISEYKSVSAPQLAARLGWEIDEIGIDRVEKAAINTYGELSNEFIKLIYSLKFKL